MSSDDKKVSEFMFILDIFNVFLINFGPLYFIRNL